jgi:hypothetical protein
VVRGLFVALALPRWAATVVVVTLVAAGVAAGPIDPSASAAPRSSGQLRPPRTSTTQDARYLTDVADADSDLVSYVNQYGNAALRGLLADGLAFCAFLKRGGGIDNALVNEAVGARADEKSTHLPLNIHTFNTLESVALVDLCPGETRLVPTSVRAELRQLSGELRAPAPAPSP